MILRLVRHLEFRAILALAVVGCSGAVGPNGGEVDEQSISSPITVTSPVNGATDSSPVWVRAHVTGCNGAAPTLFGYSIDAQTNLIDGVTHYDIDTTQALSAGAHVIHFKAWSSNGACPVVNSTFTVGSSDGIAVVSPQNGSTVSAPVHVQASVTNCGGMPTTAFGYSVDDQSSLTLGTATSIDKSDSSIAAGAHVIHFKAWAHATMCPVVDSNITVGGGGLTIPSNAIAVSHIERLGSWQWKHDPGTTGSSNGSSSLESTLSRDGEARVFSMTYGSGGGEIYHVSFGSDPNATHFVYDNWFYITDPKSLQNLEMDMNQVVANGDTIIYGVQCAHDSKSWEYTENAGTRTAIKDHWLPSNIGCDPQAWAANAWHHVQIAYHRDASGNGNVTYDSVTFDGTTTAFQGATVFSAFSLGWGSTLLTNFQLDGAGSADSITAYADEMTVYRW
jgi:hypothetical protein